MTGSHQERVKKKKEALVQTWKDLRMFRTLKQDEKLDIRRRLLAAGAEGKYIYIYIYWGRNICSWKATCTDINM